MKLNKAEIIHIRLPLVRYFQTSFGRVEEKDTVILKLYSKDLAGYGEGSSLGAPLYIPEYTDETFLALKKFLLPSVVGKEFNTPEALIDSYSYIRGHNFAKTALETAFWHLYSQTENKSLKELLGGVRDEIEVGESLSIRENIDEVLAEVQLRLDEGYKRIKVKIKPGWDIKIAKAIREKFGNIDLMLDGNSAYTLKDLDTLKQLDDFKLTMLEQPLGYDDIIDHAALQKEIKTPICLDESIITAEDARKAIEIGACKIINIKPGRVGGLIESKKIHDLCKEKGIGVWCGGILETCIGRFFNIVVASLPNFIYPADMSPSPVFFNEDLVDKPFTVENGKIKVPSDLNRDFTISEDKIKKYTVASETIE